MLALFLSVLARSIMLSAAFCCSHGPGAARRVLKAATETGLHCWPPPAVSCITHVELSIVKEIKPERTQACSHLAVESAMTCAMRFVNGAPWTDMEEAARPSKRIEI